MRVRKVKLRGFLTYKDEELIDFTRLFDKKIFLISGPTGSGKTTIFDAIAFALYGEVPREIGMEDLRSDYLSEEDYFTYVDLEFSLAEKIYKIIRVPSQRAVEIKSPKNISHRVELYDITEGKILLADKVKDADDKIRGIVGLDKSQFSKVMLLAQGQFQKFLISKSDEKAALLSDIFKTDALRSIQNELKMRSLSNKKKFSQVDKDLENVLTYNEILKEKISEDLILSRDFENIIKIIASTKNDQDLLIENILEKLGKLNENEKSLITDLEKAKTLNENIEKFKKADEAYKNLLIDFDKNKKIKADLDLISYALSIKIYEERLEKSKVDLQNFKEKKVATEKILEEKTKSLKEIEKEIKSLPIYKDKLDKLKISHSQKTKEIADFEEFLLVKKSYEEIRNLDKNLEKLQNAVKEDEEKLENLRVNFDKTNKDLNKAKDEDFNLREKISKINNRLEKLGQDYKKLKENKGYEEILAKLSTNYEKTQTLLKKADSFKDNFEINKLIDRLNTEGVCPVCGKIHEGKREKLPVINLDIEKINQDLAAITIDLEKTKAIYENNIKDLSSDYKLVEIEKIIYDNKDALESFSDLYNKNEDQIKLLSKSLNEIKNQGLILKKEKETREKSINEILNRLKNSEELKIKYVSLNKAMTGVDRDLLLTQKKNLEEKITSLESYIKDRQKVYQDLVVEVANNKSKLASVLDNISKADYDIGIYLKDFEEKLLNKFESKEVYKNYLAKESELKTKKEIVEEYFKNLEREKTIRENFLYYKDQKSLNLDTLKDKLEEVSQEIKILDKEKTLALTRLSLIKKDLEKIEKIYEDYKTLSKTAYIVSNLSDLANGVTGGVKGIERLDFETFILSVYFDRVLNFANIRFNQMTDGQFSMVRKTEATDARSKMGLDIEILDSNTGKKRPASTLSGGENFLASLSLALGLSDEIGAENGGIRIDTLFIDEGFGTLSKEFLANAIETLEKLSKEDRFIGLISHVDELKDAIEAKILITYDPSCGSSLEIVDD